MAPITSIAGVVGIAKQASAGALAANPTFAHGVSGGAPIGVAITETAQEVTTGKRVASNVIRESSRSGFDIQSPAYLRSLGLYLLGALGAVVTTGSGPYSHAFATGDLPYLSTFLKGVGSQIEGIRDCKIDELSLKWEGSKPLEFNAKGSGTVFSYPATFTPTTDETGSDAFLVPVGGTFEVDVIGGSPASARVIGGEIMVKNNVATIDPSATIESGDVMEGRQEHTLKLTVVPDDLLYFRSVVTGATGGTSVKASPTYGSVNLQFKQAQGGAGTLTVAGTRIAFLTAFPDVDPAGGVIELELAGLAVMPSGGTAPLVYTLSNTQTAY